MEEEKKKVVSEFMSKNSKAQLIDKMVAAGLSEILYERAMDAAGK